MGDLLHKINQRICPGREGPAVPVSLSISPWKHRFPRHPGGPFSVDERYFEREGCLEEHHAVSGRPRPRKFSSNPEKRCPPFGLQKISHQPWRIWEEEKPAVPCIFLNPSTADQEKNDPTIERCQKRAITGGFGGLIVENLFALRSTDPSALYRVPIPPDGILDTLFRQAGIVMGGWGNHGNLKDRG